MHDDLLLNKISAFGVLGYSPEKIVILVDPDDPERLREDLDTPGTAPYKAYHKGRVTGEYTLDKALFDDATKNKNTDANDRVRARLHDDRVDDKIRENFFL
jgi:hypothetical protein